MNKEQNKIVRNISLVLAPIFFITGITQESFLYGFVIPSLLITIFLYLKKSTFNEEIRNAKILNQTMDISEIKKSINAKEGHLILGPALITMRELAYDSDRGIGLYEEELKDRLIYDCLVEIEKTLFEEDKIKSVRLKIIDLMLNCAEMEVLIMKPPTMHKLLSGELGGKIIEILKVSDSMKKIFNSEFSTTISFEELKSEITNRYFQYHFYVSAFNTVRISLKDFDRDLKKDWFRPCYISFCIWQEDNIRSALSMPKLIDNQLKAIVFSSWLSVANENPIDLREAFEAKWNNVFNEPSPFFDLGL